jgi:hypothetical protein
MAYAVRSFAAAAFVWLAACQTNPPLGSGLVIQAKDGAAAAPPPAGGGPVNGDPAKTLAPDAGAAPETIVVAPVNPSATSCAEIAATGKPDSLDELMWQRQVAEGQGSDAYDFVWIQNGCSLSSQHENVRSSVTMSPADCADARALVTSSTLINVLRTGGTCVSADVNQPDEIIIVDLLQTAPNDQPRRKFFRCDDPNLAAVRACLQPLVDRLLPR